MSPFSRWELDLILTNGSLISYMTNLQFYRRSSMINLRYEKSRCIYVCLRLYVDAYRIKLAFYFYFYLAIMILVWGMGNGSVSQ